MPYTYVPEKIGIPGKDRMRFELGDTMVEGGSDTAALTDEEIRTVLEAFPKSWKRAKLMLLESLCRRFAYEPDTKTGPLTLSLRGRAELWRKDYEALKKEVSAESCRIPVSHGDGREKPPYFFVGMLGNPGTRGGIL